MRLTNSAVGGTDAAPVTTGNSGSFSGDAWTSVAGAPQYSATSYFTTDFSIACPATGDTVTWTLPSSQTLLYVRFYFNTTDAYPAATQKICAVKDTTGTEIASAYIDDLGDVGLDFAGLSHGSNEYGSFDPGAWFYVQFSLNTSTGAVYSEWDTAGSGISGSGTDSTTFTHPAQTVVFGNISGGPTPTLLLDSFEVNSTALPGAANQPTPPPPPPDPTPGPPVRTTVSLPLLPSPAAVIPTTSFTDPEILCSANRFTQTGVTIAAGAGILLAGTVLARRTATGKFWAYDPTATDGREVARGVLRRGVDARFADQQTNLVRSAILKLSTLSGADATAITTLGATVDAVKGTFTF